MKIAIFRNNGKWKELEDKAEDILNGRENQRGGEDEVEKETF